MRRPKARLAVLAVAAMTALALPSSTAHAATGTFKYLYSLPPDAMPPWNLMQNPPSGVCHPLSAKANALRNYTDRVAYIYYNDNCTGYGEVLYVNNWYYGAHLYSFQSVWFL